MRVSLNFGERWIWLRSLTERPACPTERAWFWLKTENASLWFWLRGQHMPPTLWPRGSSSKSEDGARLVSHSAPRTPVPGRSPSREGGPPYMHLATQVAAEGGDERARASQTFQWERGGGSLPDYCHAVTQLWVWPEGSSPLADLTGVVWARPDVPFLLPVSPKSWRALERSSRP